MSRAFGFLAAVVVVFTSFSSAEARGCRQASCCRPARVHHHHGRCCATPAPCSSCAAPAPCCAAPAAPCCSAPAPCSTCTSGCSSVSTGCSSCGTSMVSTGTISSGCTSGCSASPAPMATTYAAPASAPVQNAPAPPAEQKTDAPVPAEAQ